MSGRDGHRTGRGIEVAHGLSLMAVLAIGCNPTFGEWPADTGTRDVRDADAEGAADGDAEVEPDAPDAEGDADGDADADVDAAGDGDADACDPEVGCCSAADCDDGVLCTDDLCDPASRRCSNTLRSGWCRIDGACRSDGEMNPSNPCLECRASADTAAWTDACPHHVTETTFEDFRDGTFPRSAGDLYVASDGSVRVIRAGDLDGDGWHDIVFSNSHDGTTPRLDSYIYWGSASGFSASSRTSLPTLGARGNSVADLNGDGYLDVAFSNHRDDTTYRVDSYIYWGSASGFSASSRTLLPTLGAIGNSVADLNGDGYLDVVFSNQRDDTTHRVDSYIYWGSASGFSASSRTSLPTVGAYGNSVADLNGDGYLDVVFSNYEDDTTYRVDSYIYWGSALGLSPSSRQGLPTVGAHSGTMADLGNIYDRGPDETYQSGPVDIGEGHSLTRLGWSASLPLECSVRFRLRSAATTAALGSATWHGPAPGVDWYTTPMARTNPVHSGHRYIQYQAVLSSPTHRAAPALDSVTLYFE